MLIVKAAGGAVSRPAGAEAGLRAVTRELSGDVVSREDILLGYSDDSRLAEAWYAVCERVCV